MASALTFLMRYHTDGDAFLDQIVTGDETWVSHNIPETKRQSPSKFVGDLQPTLQRSKPGIWERNGDDEREEVSLMESLEENLNQVTYPNQDLNSARSFHVLTYYGTKIVLQWLKERKLVINKIYQLGPMGPSTNSRDKTRAQSDIEHMFTAVE
ncbi:hypothetical protein ANN_06187 [Periplaneta americana]|uniref:Uncharacterized protein n=1 Tax=Periplaneta americana TaxID=6978 RepID=A0ABQ8TEV7_PERAM|nr:hypothetical protein ANN_06187 [Periplaneta americana]